MTRRRPSIHARDHPKRAGRDRRQHHPPKSRGKAEGGRKARALDVELNNRLASWQVAAANAGAPASAGVDYYLAEYLGWEDETDCEDKELVRDEECYLSRYPVWEEEGYGAPATYGGPAEDEECYLPGYLGWEPAMYEGPVRDEELYVSGYVGWEGEELAREWDIEPVLLDDMWTWGMLAAGLHNVEVMMEQGAKVEVEQEEEEAAGIDHYEMMVKWKKRQQKRKKMKRKQQRKSVWKKDLHPGPAPLCHFKAREDEQEQEEAEMKQEEEHKPVSYQHMKTMKQQEERTTLDDDNEEEKEDHVGEPGEMKREEVGERERVANERERGDPEEVVGGKMVTEEKEREETQGEEEGPDDDFGFCNVGFTSDYVDEEDWCVVGGVAEM